MILAAFLAICAAGALLGAAVRSDSRLGQLIGLVFLAGATGTALAIGSGEPLTVGNVELSATSYASAFLAVASGACLLLCLVGAATQPAGRLAPAALAALGGFGVALTSADPRVSLVAGAAAAATGALTATHHPSGAPRDGRLSEIRILGLIAGAMLLAAVVLMRPLWNGGDSRAIGLAFLGLVLAVAVRSGAVPFHVPAAHLSRNAIPMAPALVLVWIPAGLAALALTWSPLAFRVDSDWIAAGIAAIQIVAVATIVLGAMGALAHDELEEVAGYSIVSDAGFILLALAARTEAAAEPARLWLLIFVAVKTGLVAWVAAMCRAFGTSRLGRLRGWLRRTPILGLCLLAIAVATLGWPGSEVARVRGELVRLGLPDGLGFLTGLAVALSIGYYARLIVIGLLPATDTVRESWSERPRFGFVSRAAKEEAAALAASGEVVATLAAVPAPDVVPAELAAGASVAKSEGPAAGAEGAAAGAEGAVAGAEGLATDAAVRPKRKRRARTAAAEEPMPTVAAEPQAENAATPATPATAALPETPAGAPPPRTVDLVMARPKTPGMTLRHRLALVWRLNRTLEVSLVVVAAAGLSLAVAAGSFGASNAAQVGIPLGTAAHATPTATPLPSLPPTQAPLPTGSAAPSATPSTSASAAPTGSPATPGGTFVAPSPVIK